MLSRLKLSHKGLLLIAIPLAFQAMLVLAVGFILRDTEAEIQREVWARDLQTHLTRLNALLTASGVSAQQYGIRPSPDILRRYQNAISQVPKEFRTLETLAAGHQEILDTLSKLEISVTAASTRLDQGLALIGQGDIVGSFRLLLPLVPAMKKITNEVDELSARAQAIQDASPKLQVQARQRLMALLALAVVVNVGLAFALAMHFNRTTARRLACVMDNTRRFGAGRRLNDLLPGKDEISELDGLFHDMADTLEAAARRERVVVENAVDVICSISAEGMISAVNPAVLRSWGFDKGDLQGRPYADLVDPEDREEVLRTVERMMTQGLSDSFECRIRRSEGSILHTLWSAHYSQNERSLFCVVHDITLRKLAADRLKESEARARLILEAMPVGLLVLDLKGTIESANPLIATMLGYEQEDFAGRSLISLAAQSRPIDFERDIGSQAIGRAVEIAVARKNNSNFPAEILLREFESVEGPRFLCVMLDVSQRHEVERMKQEFVAMVSHDLRTPLASVQAFLTMVAEGVYGGLPDSIFTDSQSADEHASKLLCLVSDLLDLEKMESGHFTINCEEFPIVRLIERAIESVRERIDRYGVEIQCLHSPGVVLADQERLVQAVGSLISYLSSTGWRGSAVSISSEENDDAVEIKVSGTGRALTREEQETLFDRFRYLKGTTSGERGDLGLVLAKAITTQHGGTIGMVGEGGGAKTLWIRLPNPTSALSG